MSWLGNLFAGAGDTPAPAAARPAFPERAAAAADALAAAARPLGRDLSPAAYSTLQRIPDLIRPIIVDAAEHPLLAEREFAVESLLTDLVPATLTAFLRIPPAERADGSDADAALVDQLETLALAAVDTVAAVRRDAVAAFEANQLFLDAKFT
jgi:hypothetical protein